MFERIRIGPIMISRSTLVARHFRRVADRGLDVGRSGDVTFF